MGGYFPWVKRYLRPQSLDEAIAAMNEFKDAAAVVAGGTSVAMRLPRRVEVLVDLQDLGLDKVQVTDAGLKLGAMANLRKVEKAAAGAWGGVIASACSTVGSRLVRNAATLGGEMAAGLPWCDIPVLMAALDARVSVSRPDGEEAVSAWQWTSQRPSDILGSGVITRLLVPGHVANEGAGFYKVMRVQGEYGAAVAAAWVRLDEHDTITACRLVSGGVSPHAVALNYAQDALVGSKGDDTTLKYVASMIEQRFKPASDPRFDRAYRQKMTGVAAKRAVQQAIAMAKGGR